MRIQVKNISAKFDPDPIWNEIALGFLEKAAQQEKNNDNDDPISDTMDVDMLSASWPGMT